MRPLLGTKTSRAVGCAVITLMGAGCGATSGASVHVREAYKPPAWLASYSATVSPAISGVGTTLRTLRAALTKFEGDGLFPSYAELSAVAPTASMLSQLSTWAGIFKNNPTPGSPDYSAMYLHVLLEEGSAAADMVTLSISFNGVPVSVQVKAERELSAAINDYDSASAELHTQLGPSAAEVGSPSPTRPEPTSTMATGTKTGQRLRFSATEGSGGGEIATAADTANLTGTSAVFRTFIAGVFAKTDTSMCTQTQTAPVTVDDYDSRGFASGGVGCGGGAAVVWALAGGTWKEVAESQNAWDCGVLIKYRVPSWLLGNETYCIDGTTYTHP